MTSRVTESKPDFRPGVSWGETRAYEGQPTPRVGRSNSGLLVNIKLSQRNTKIVGGLKIINNEQQFECTH